MSMNCGKEQRVSVFSAIWDEEKSDFFYLISFLVLSNCFENLNSVLEKTVRNNAFRDKVLVMVWSGQVRENEQNVLKMFC